jgi:hypothetical protein
MDRIADVEEGHGLIRQIAYVRRKDKLLTSLGDNIVIIILDDFGSKSFNISQVSHDRYSTFET